MLTIHKYYRSHQRGLIKLINYWRMCSHHAFEVEVYAPQGGTKKSTLKGAYLEVSVRSLSTMLIMLLPIFVRELFSDYLSMKR